MPYRLPALYGLVFLFLAQLTAAVTRTELISCQYRCSSSRINALGQPTTAAVRRSQFLKSQHLLNSRQRSLCTNCWQPSVASVWPVRVAPPARATAAAP